MEESPNTLPGPMFEAGPGWGERLGQWIRSRWSTKLFPAIAVVVLLAGMAKVYSQPQEKEPAKDKESFRSDFQAEISATVNKGDGIIVVSRRALAAYLKEFPDIQLKPEEHLYIENFFQTKFREIAPAIGQEIKFLKTDFEQSVNEALQLTEGQRQKLRDYLK